MSAAHKYDWPTVEQIFIQAPDRYPHVTLKDVSKQFSIPYQTLRRYAAHNKWVSRRDEIYYQARKLREPIRNHTYSTRGMHKSVVHMLQNLTNANIPN
jgi:hypothetical protein